MLDTYRQHVAERAALGSPAALDGQTNRRTDRTVEEPPAGEEQNLVELLTHRVPAGVDDAAKRQGLVPGRRGAGQGSLCVDQPRQATELLGTMLGGYNIGPLIELLDDAEIGTIAAEALKKTLLMFDSFHDVKEKADKGNANARLCCKAGPTPNGSPAAPSCPRA